MLYGDVKLKTPEVFENTKQGKKVLIIASGHSTGKLLPHKEKIRSKFDVVVACNYSFQHFDDVIDFHIVTEKTSEKSANTIFRILNDGKFRTDVPRIVNYKGIELYSTRYNLMKTIRSDFNASPNIKKYKHNGQEGLLIGPVGKQGFALGSVSLSALHFASMLGAAEIYIIGADMCFKDQYDHFYKDKVYRNPPPEVKKSNRHKIVKASVNGQEFETTEFFKESAEYIDKVITTSLADTKVFDFSDGLLTAPTKLDADEFFKEI